MSDLTTYLHMGVTVVTTLSTLFLAYIQYRDKKVASSVNFYQNINEKIKELEINFNILQERVNNNREELNKLIDLAMKKRNENE